MKKIILFMAYYGKLPSYFPVWLRAVENNTTVDFCIISDCLGAETSVPENVKLLNISFEEFKSRIQSKFKFKVNIENYGRISQFRPAFAYIFDDIVKGYDNWGFIECDLIPGDIRAFLTDDVLENNDKIFKLGHFQVFKNNACMNRLFMERTPKALNYKFAFSRNVLYFEEVIGMHNIALAKNCRIWDERVFVDVIYYGYPFVRSNFTYPGQSKETCIFEYDRGKLFEIYLGENQVIQRREILYAHIQKRPMEIITDDFDHYLMVPNAFEPYREVPVDEYKSIIRNAEGNVQYYKDNKEKESRSDAVTHKKNIDWWLFYIIRLRLKLLNSFGLSGKKGVL